MPVGKLEDTLMIRWLIANDLEEVLVNDRRSFVDFWTESRWRNHLKQRNCIAMVAVLRDGNLQRIVGAMLYELHKSHLELLRLFVAPDYRRQGIGSAMVAKLLKKLSVQRRRVLAINVGEYNLAAQLWLSGRGFWGHSHDDQIRFEYVTEEVVGPETSIAS